MKILAIQLTSRFGFRFPAHSAAHQADDVAGIENPLVRHGNAIHLNLMFFGEVLHFYLRTTTKSQQNAESDAIFLSLTFPTSVSWKISK
jgi:hypothetical protein